MTANNVLFHQVADLSMGDLLLHTSVTWINPPASLGKWKKEPQMATFGMFRMTFHHDDVISMTVYDVNCLSMITDVFPIAF